MSLPESMIELSTITRKQVESLVSFARVKRKEITLREAGQTRSDRSVSVGSYYHTVNQGREKIRASIRTLIIGLWLGLVKPEDLRKLLEVAGRGLPDIGEEGTERASAIIEALLSQIVV